MLTGQAPRQADVVFVNIIADVIIGLLPGSRPLCGRGGKVLLSGIIKERLQDVLSAAGSAGYAVERTLAQGEWDGGLLPPLRQKNEETTCIAFTLTPKVSRGTA